MFVRVIRANEKCRRDFLSNEGEREGGERFKTIERKVSARGTRNSINKIIKEMSKTSSRLLVRSDHKEITE